MGAIVLGLGLFSWGALTYFRIERRPANAIDVQVVGKQWMWKLQHAEGKREINELHVPVNRTVVLTMTSQDVIHSFFVPAFRVKQDVVPGRYTSEWFKAIKPGEYHLFCAEYCGTQHSGMIGRVVVMEPRAYEEWLKTGEQTESIVLAGQRLFHDRGCSGCHSPNSKFHAPLLEGLYRKPVPLADGTMVRADDQYLRDSILQPAKQITAGYDNIMPSFAGHLSEEEIMQLIAYVKAIGQQEPPPQMISARYNCCRVRCPQRINPAAAKESPLRTADATAVCHRAKRNISGALHWVSLSRKSEILRFAQR